MSVSVLPRPALLVVAPLASALLLLGGCGASSSSSPETQPSGEGTAAGPGDGSYRPVTVEHAFGTTTVEERPQRVVSWGWGSADASIALGVTPVAIPTQSYGGDEDGVLPWIAEALEKRGEPTPTMLADAEEPPYEEIAAAEPDVILAHYSGITEKQYDLLSQIAPTVAYPGQAWSTPWREVVTTTGRVLGRTQEATRLLRDIDAEVAAAADEVPELAGRSVAAVADGGGTFYVYKPADPRVDFLNDLGLPNAPSVPRLANGSVPFFYTLSYEQLDQLTSDVLVVYGDSQRQLDRFVSSDAAQAMAQVRQDRVVEVVGESAVSSVSPPTALSLTWGISDFVEELRGVSDDLPRRS